MNTKNMPIPKTYSRYTHEATILLGNMIRLKRIERRISVGDLAARVGISRDMMRRAEKGDPRCAIGAVFEAASIVGIPLFAENQAQLEAYNFEVTSKLALLPKAIHKPKGPVKDDF